VGGGDLALRLKKNKNKQFNAFLFVIYLCINLKNQLNAFYSYIYLFKKQLNVFCIDLLLPILNLKNGLIIQ
jgi:hypothetical protein